MSRFGIQPLDYSKLQPLSKNSFDSNHKTIAKDSDVCKEGINIFLRNYEQFLLSTSVFECSSLLISENNWFTRKGNTQCIDKTGLNLLLCSGQLVQVDYGKNYDVECGLIHYGIILKVEKSKILLIPMTTNKEEIEKAYHPIVNPTGEFYLRKGLVSEGFLKDVALYINDIKCVSIGRVIPYINVDIIKEEPLNLIKEHVLRFYFSDMFKRIDESIKQLKNENSKLRNTIKDISGLIKNIDRTNA
jgi:hypothetical protein